MNVIKGKQRSVFDWNQARAFLVTAEEGSLSGAARALGLTQPTLSRQVAGIEEALGVTLFERTSRSLLLTRAGVELLEHFRSMGEAASRISIAATGQSETVSGHVVLTMTDLAATHFLPPVLKRLEIDAPNLRIEVVTSNQISDLMRREADIAIRHTRPQDLNLIAKRLRDATARAYAARAYLDRVGRPGTVADLSGLQFVGTEDPERLIAPLAAMGAQLTGTNFRFIAPSGVLMLELVRQGFGVSFLPEEIARKYPELEDVVPSMPALPVETWLVTHRELRTNPGIRLVFDVLSESF